MTVAAVGYKLFGLVEGVVNVLSLIHCQYRGELFVGELLGNINALNLADKNFGLFGNLNARKRGDGNRLLTYYLSVKRAVYNNGLANLLGLLGV